MTMMLRVLLLVACALVAVRLPSLAQPMGADQALYAYVGERILQGERPYLDAWDQKPPAIHYTYAVLRAIWPADAVVAAADLAAAAVVAVLLFWIGRDLVSRQVGAWASVLFLFLANPAFGRLAGVRVRAQCETFIAVTVAGAVWLLIRHARGAPWAYGVAGLLLGAAVTFKYNAAVYAAAAAVGILASGSLTPRRAVTFGAGCAALPIACLALFADALPAWFDATVTYNLRYSGETYRGPLDFVRYLLTFPVAHARVDALWTIGGAGCAVLLAGAARDPRRLVPVAWVAVACLSIAINSSRGLPQYFVQAAPALALAAAWAAAVLAGAVRARWPARQAHAVLALVLVAAAVATWRVNQFPKLVEQTVFDAHRLAGRIDRDTHLARYVDEQKYTALGADRVGRLMQAHSAPDDTVYLFGFTAGAYVHAGRESASRFFWSRPVIAGFKEGTPGYGVTGLLDDLRRSRPAVVALQIYDWAPDVEDSAQFFLSRPPLAEWLAASYRRVDGPAGFDVWVRQD
jgi:4-amino-4-deoxy-L-arabinose transferase-like glycosyltransferase